MHDNWRIMALLTVDVIAKAARVSRHTLIRRLMNHLQKPPCDVLRELRVDHA